MLGPGRCDRAWAVLVWVLLALEVLAVVLTALALLRIPIDMPEAKP